MPSNPNSLPSQDPVPLCIPEIQGNEWTYIKECLDTNWVSSVGAFVDRFEETMAEYVGAEYAVATASGTSALHIALLAAGVQPDDEVLVSDLTFIAPVNVIRYVGAWPVFMDADPTYWQMDPQKVADFLEKECLWRGGAPVNKVTGRRVKAILPVHLLGHPCDMDPLLDIASRHGLAMVEDASESLGARYGESMVGRLGDVGCFSFNGNKLITAGGGGMLVTNRPEWARKARHLTNQAKDDPVEYIHSEIGYNYRLTNIQAALGVAQMERVDEFIARKRAIAATYEAGLGDLEGVTLMPSAPGTEPTYWLYTILLHPETTLSRRKDIITALNTEGIGTRPLFHPIHALPPYSGCQAYRIENSLDLYRRGVCLPSSVGLGPGEQARSIAAVRRTLLG